MADDDKTIFVAFAIEDVKIRDLIKGQSLNTKVPFSYTDMSVKEAYDEEWKKKVLTRIRRSAGVLVIASRDSLTSSGQKWEIKCAQEEKKKIRGIWGYTDDRTKIEGVNTMVWTWDNIKDWIDTL
jgi:antiphage defense system Thoeris ThsB-like protein